MFDIQQGYVLPDVVNAITAQLKKTLIQRVLHETNGNKTQAAKRLKIGYKTRYRKLQQHAID